MAGATPTGGGLAALRTALQEQADAGGSLSVSAATVEKAGLTPAPEFDQLLRGHLGGDLAVGFSGTVPEPSGSQLTFSGGVATLNVKATAELTFELGAGEVVNVRVAIELPQQWTFGASFAALQGQPFDGMALGNARYVVTTAAKDEYEWEGVQYPLVPRGAWFIAKLGLSGPLGIVVSLLEGATDTEEVVLRGPIDPSHLKTLGEGLPELDLTATLSHGIAIPYFELAEPRLEMSTLSGEMVETAFGALQQRYCWLTFATTLSSGGKPFCKFQASVPAEGASSVTFTFSPISESADPGAGEINTLLGGKVDFRHAVPPQLEEIFKKVQLEAITATVAIEPHLEIASIGAAIGATEPWVTSDFKVTQVRLAVNVLEPLGASASMTFTIEATARFFEQIFHGDFDVSLLYSPQAGNLSVAAGFVGEADLIRLVETLSDNTVKPPKDLSMSFSDFGVTYEKSGSGYVYTLYGTADASFQLPFLATNAESSLQFLAISNPKKYELIGGLVLGDSFFQAKADIEQNETTFTGSWTALHGDYLELRDLTKYVGYSPPQPPTDLDLGLKEASFTYEVTEPLFVLEAESANWGGAVFAGLKVKGAWVYFGGVKIEKPIDLTKLPLIGKALGPLETLAIDDIEATVSSLLDEEAVGEIAKHLHLVDPQPRKEMSGVTLAMAFDVGGHKYPLQLHAGGEQSGEGRQLQTLAAGESEKGTYWVNVQKTLGPVSVQKVGVRYADNHLWVLMNASLAGGGLTIELFGLGVGSPLSSFDPEFTIEGLGVTFIEGPVELSGALVGKLDPLEFAGSLRLKVENLQIGALGAYCEVEHHPSFFLYALLDYPLGGPPFFFVTGLAAGFGFNRRLLVPGVDGVATFPFVQWAAGEGSPPATGAGVDVAKEVGKVVSELETSGVVAPAVGEYWGALGVRFKSFEVVDGFALLLLVFGTRFEVDLLGLATVTAPTPEKPVAEAQLALKASFVPSTGLLGVSGQLTPQSYVLSKEAHLTGGFAFYSWVSGEHAGDFVLTLGGYSPRYTVPEYFPQVPRLGLNWKVSDELTVTGDLYFALTSSAVMAGGGMSAVWQSGDIRAWFEVEADFLLVFQPFHYYLSAGIHLGASFTIDLLFTSITVSIHLGVGLEIWGPDFAGKARIDLSIISFTVGFGSGDPATSTKIGWGEFVEKLLPAPKAPAGLAAADSPAPAPVVQIRIADGLIKELSEEPGQLNWVVNGAKLRLATHSLIPVKTSFFSKNVELDKGPVEPNTDFGVGPTQTAADEFTSECELTVTTTEDSIFVAEWVLGNVPKAFWEPREFDQHGVPKDVDPVNGTTIEKALVGFTLTAKVEEPDHTLLIPLEYLQYTIDPNLQHFEWSNAPTRDSDPFAAEKVWETIEDAGAAATRKSLMAAIEAEDLPVPAVVDVSELGSRKTYDLIASPVLRLLGEQR